MDEVIDRSLPIRRLKCSGGQSRGYGNNIFENLRTRARCVQFADSHVHRTLERRFSKKVLSYCSKVRCQKSQKDIIYYREANGCVLSTKSQFLVIFLRNFNFVINICYWQSYAICKSYSARKNYCS